MPLAKLNLKPGVIKDTTQYTAEGGWYDSDKIRFRMGFPESIGGWVKYSSNTYLGTARAVHQWTSIDGTNYMAIGTHLKLYVETGGTYYDITPIRRTVTLGANPLQTQSTSNGKLTVTDASHGAVLNDFVTFSGATAFDNYTTGMLNAEHQIIEIIGTNSYTIEISGVLSAGAGVNGGGAAISAAYQINTGPDSQIFGTGWGSGTYSRGTWGSASSSGVTTGQIRIWSLDNFGEDLVAAVRGGGIYYWTEDDGTSTRAVSLSSLSGSNQAPTICLGAVVSEVDRHLLIMGANEYGSATVNALLIRFSDQENATEWEERTDTTAGALLISSGSHIVGWTRSRQETLIWTDHGLYAYGFTGPPATFGINEIAHEVSLIGPNAVAEEKNTVYWMDTNAFRLYDGNVSVVPCPVQNYVFSDLNFDQRYKVFGATNSRYDEIWWFYPSASSEEVDRYVKFNYIQNAWDVGSLFRSAWLDNSFSTYPIALANGYVYIHETGTDADGSALESYIEGADYDIADGEQYSFIRRLIPDVTMVGSNVTGNIVLTLKRRNFANQDFTTASASNVLADTEQCHVRVRGRQFALRVSSGQQGLGWRLGSTRFDLQADGEKS